MPLSEILAEKHLQKADKKAFEAVAPGILEQFEQVRDKIEAVLSETEYFHGTGRLVYGFKGEDQYKGIDHSKVVDRLPALMNEGIKPNADLFSRSFTGEGNNKSVSITKNRQYARIYSGLHMKEGEKYAYEYGSQAFWWLYLLYVMAVTAFHSKPERKLYLDAEKRAFKTRWNNRMESTRHVAQKAQKVPVLAYLANAYLFILQYLYFKNDPSWEEWQNRPEEEKQRTATEWIGRFRKDCAGDTKNLSGWKKAYLYNKFAATGKSDIEGNYGMIIGLKKGGVEKIPVKRKPVSIFETRAGNVLEKDAWSYIEVPYAKIRETRKAIREIYGDRDAGEPEIPVFATEHVEMVMREKHLSELAAKDEDNEQ